MNFRSRLESKISWLRSIPNIYIVEAKVNPPIQEELIERHHQRLGFELDERFLRYFRECNGWSLQWLYAERPPADPRAELERLIAAEEHWKYGRFTVPSLLTRPDDGRDPRMVSTDGQLRFLGGVMDAALRSGSYEIEAYGSLPSPDRSMTQYHDILLYTSATHPDPICYLSTDYYADLSNFRPMRARSFFELGLAYLGAPKLISWFEGKGYDGDHALVELEQDALPASLFCMELDPIRERAQASQDYLNALGRRAKLSAYQRFDERLPALSTAHPYRALLKGDGDLTVGQLLMRLRSLEIFEEEQEDKERYGIRLRYKVTGPQLEACSAYLQMFNYNKPSGPTEYELEECAIYYQEGAPKEELHSTLKTLGLKVKKPKRVKGGEVDYQEIVINTERIKVHAAMESLKALGFTQEERLPVSWSKDYHTLRLHTPSPSGPNLWVELGFIGPPRPEGEEPLSEAELIYNDELSAEDLNALHALFDELGVSLHPWRSL